MSTFADVLGNLEGGRAFEDLNEQLQDLVTAVLQHQKAGDITLVLKISPNGERAVSVLSSIKAKVPEGARGVTTFYADAGGNLLRRDPRQPELPLRDVADDKPREFRTV